MNIEKSQEVSIIISLQTVNNHLAKKKQVEQTLRLVSINCSGQGKSAKKIYSFDDNSWMYELKLK